MSQTPQYVRWLNGNEKPKEKKEEKKEEAPKKEEVQMTQEELRKLRLQKLNEKKEEVPKKIEEQPIKKVEEPKKIDVPVKKVAETKKIEVPIKKVEIPIIKKQVVEEPKKIEVKKVEETKKIEIVKKIEVKKETPPNSGSFEKGSFEDKGSMNIEERYIHGLISIIFDVSLKKGGDSVYLENIFLMKKTLFPFELLEVILCSRLGKERNPFGFLISCFKRCQQELIKEKKKKEINQERIEKIEEMKRLIISYFGIISLNENIVPDISIEKNHLKILKCFIDRENQVPDEFFEMLINRFSNDGIEKIFLPIIEEMHLKMKQMNFLDIFMPYIELLKRLTNYNEICQMIVNLPYFLGESNQRNGSWFEKSSYLGPFFNLNTFYDPFPKVSQEIFKDVRKITVMELEELKNQIRIDIRQYQIELHDIILNFLKKKDISKIPITQWIGFILEGNKTRAMMQRDFNTSSEDGFMINLCGVLLRLCKPFVEKKSFNQIDSNYLLTKHLVNFIDETKLSIEGNQVNQLVKDLKMKQYNFITEIFFLTYRALQLGYLKQYTYYAQSLKILNDLSKKMKMDSKIENEYYEGCILKWSMELNIFESEIISMTTSFYLFSSKWIISIVDPEFKGLPFKKDPPKEFSILNEYHIDNITEYFLYLTRYYPSKLDGINLKDLFDMMTCFMHHSNYILNPYIKSKFPELLSTFVPFGELNTYGEPKDPIFYIKPDLLEKCISKNVLSDKYLIPGLMKLYVDIERTGSSTQFYDKFTPRYFTALFLKYIWRYKNLRDSFLNESKSEEALKFFNMMLNDAIYLLDESLKILVNINKFEQDIKDPSWNSLSPQQQRERENEIVGQERQVTSYMLLANQTVHMMNYLSRDAPTPFLRSEMVSRVSSMLNYFLDHLVGTTCQNLKVAQPERYHFDAKYLLSEITDTYINLSSFQEFIDAVAYDERSYKDSVFSNTVNILKRIKRRDENHISKFESFQKKAKESFDKKAEMEIDLGDIPDEYADPITMMLMEDPVILPSKHTVDRSTITRHLLSDPTDPFSRQIMTKDDLIPNIELKKEIQEWKNSKLKK